MQRSTRQRRAIADLFAACDRPLAPQEVVSALESEGQSISLATVYRALRDLTDSGELEPVELPGQPPRYERAGLAHHHHFLCDSCGRLYDIPGCPKTIHGLAPKGFKATHHELTLVGTCPEC
ncbi:MAG: transcriptional repressor [Planctomycetota bacterium]